MNAEDKKNFLEETGSLDLQFEKRGGILPVITQEIHTGEVLMLSSVNPEAVERTLETGLATYWSTSRKELWVKGKTSGDFLKIIEIWVDCDQDALIYKVEMIGSGACHTLDKNGYHRKSCFYRKWNGQTKMLDLRDE